MIYKKSRSVIIGGSGQTNRLAIGGDNPVSIQTMWKEGIVQVLTDAQYLFSIVERIEHMRQLGCDIIRFAVPDMDSAEALLKIAPEVTVPLVADIHFDYKLALRCLDGNIAKVRINPGNIGSIEKVRAVVEKAKATNTAIRIGVNSGSLPRDLSDKVLNGQLTRAEALVQTAAREVAVFDELNFHNVIVSMKASSVQETVESNTIFASLYDVPLHIGVTEAGPLIGGIVKSTLAFSRLLSVGIGSTIRVSLSSEPENEIITGKHILTELGLRKGGVQIVSCPRCGRNGFDVHGFVDRWQTELLSLDKDITVAVMGCVVNGPGEAKHADIGITGAGNSVMIFKEGRVVKTVTTEECDRAFREELYSL